MLIISRFLKIALMKIDCRILFQNLFTVTRAHSAGGTARASVAIRSAVAGFAKTNSATAVDAVTPYLEQNKASAEPSAKRSFPRETLSNEFASVSPTSVPCRRDRQRSCVHQLTVDVHLADPKMQMSQDTAPKIMQLAATDLHRGFLHH